MSKFDSTQSVTARVLVFVVLLASVWVSVFAQSYPAVDGVAMEVSSKVNRLDTDAGATVISAVQREEFRAFLTQFLPERRPFTDHELDAMIQGDFQLVRDMLPESFWSVVYIENGIPMVNASPVGMLLKGSDTEDFQPFCTVILTRPDVVLTARHCAEGLHANERFKIFFQFEGFREPKGDVSIFCVKGKPVGCTWIDDLATIQLNSPYSNLPVAKLGDSSVSAVDTNVSVAGFGKCYDENSGTKESLEYCGGIKEGNHGIRRQGSVKLAECTKCSTFLSPQNLSRQICIKNALADNELPIAALSVDSGSPIINGSGNQQKLVGIASAAQNCKTSDGTLRGIYVDVTDDFYQKWLEENAFGPDVVSTSLGGKWEVLKEEVFLRLEPYGQQLYRLNVPDGASKIIVTLNHEVGDYLSPVDIDLVLPDRFKANCVRHKGAEVCTVEDPVPAKFDFSVSRKDTCGIQGRVSDTECLPRAFQMTAVCFNCSESGQLEEK